MESYCAFLRGVNVNGTSMKMLEVCKVFEESGMKAISSVLATGNIIFSFQLSREDLKILLQKALSQHFNYDAHLFIKTKKEVQEIVSQDPFIKNSENHIYSLIVNEGIEEILLHEFLKAARVEGEEAEVVGQNFYWQIKKGLTLDSDFGKVLGNKKLRSEFTSRNINTIEKVLLKMNSLIHQKTTLKK